jgi:hypothetical protein
MPAATHKFGQYFAPWFKAVSGAFGVCADVAEFAFLGAVGGVNFR